MTKPQSKILYVANDKKNDGQLASLLEDYDLETVTGPEQAVKTLLKEPDKFALIVIAYSIDSKVRSQLLETIHGIATLRIIPIVIELVKKEDNQREELMKLGARYFVGHDMTKEICKPILAAAFSDSSRYREVVNGIKAGDHASQCLQEAEFKFRNLSEAQAIANFVAEACPSPRIVVVGISEMLINAVEHGNLSISYKDKTTLHDQDKWLQEIEHRLDLPENNKKYVQVFFKRFKDHIKLRIIDQGDGFDWKKFENPDPSRALDTHGRGIMMAKNLAFSDLEYFGDGNEVECTISLRDDS